MKQYFLKERDALEHSRKNAGSKARNDVENILSSIGFEPVDVVIPYKKVKTVFGAVQNTFSNYRFWKKQLSGLHQARRGPTAHCSRTSSALFGNEASRSHSSSTTSRPCATRTRANFPS